MKYKKSFDAVAMMREIRDRLTKKTWMIPSREKTGKNPETIRDRGETKGIVCQFRGKAGSAIDLRKF
jgi:hypothetical protein